MGRAHGWRGVPRSLSFTPSRLVWGRDLIAASFARLLAWCKPGVLIVTHRSADVDAVAAALALSYALSSYGGGAPGVCAPEGVDATSKRVLAALGFEVPTSRRCASERVVLVDASSPSQVEGVEFAECSLVDHHAVNTLTSRCSLSVYDPEAGAASALLAEALMLAGFRIPKSYATLLLAGIAFDTRFLRTLNPRLLRVVEWLLEMGADFGEVHRLLLQREVPYAERVARLKGLSRMSVYAVGEGYLMTITCVGAYESSSLRYAVEAGSDIALAVAPRDEDVRVTIRASDRLVRELGIPVAAELSRHLAEGLGGSGGGHEAAAGAVIPRASVGSLERVVAEFFSARGFKVRVLERGRWLEECG